MGINPWIAASTALAIALYFPLCWELAHARVKQNIATWILWVALDAVLAGTMIVQGGNYLLTVVYVIGGSITVLCISRSGEWQWTRFETLVSILVLVCIAIWISVGPKPATVVSSLAVVIAGLPQLVDGWRKPQDTPVLIYSGYTVAVFLSLKGAKDWSIEQSFYYICAGALCLLYVLVGLRKYWLKSPLATEVIS